MTGNDFRARRRRCGRTVPTAAKVLGVGRRTIFNLQKSNEIPLTTAIAANAAEIELNHEKDDK